MRILHVLYTVASGGAERTTATTVLAQQQLGADARLAVFARPLHNAIEEDLQSSGVRVIFLNKKEGLDPSLFFRLLRLYREFRPDVVHTHMNLLRYALPPALLTRVPLVMHTVHTIAEYEASGLERQLCRSSFGLNIVPVGISQAVADSVCRLYGLKHCAMVHNAIPTMRFARPENARALSRQQLGIPESDIVIACVARLVKEKNHTLLLQAFSLLAREMGNVRLLLAGGGVLRERLEQQVRELGLEGRAVLMGHVSRLQPVHWAADFNVLPSMREGFGIAMVEGMSAGNAVVCTNVGGMPEVVEHGVTGLVTPDNDVPGMHAALRTLATDAALRERMGQAGQLRAREKFDYLLMGRKYIELCEQHLAKR
jgi:glycosyltransferase involved in cell wall biosynthesis